MASFLSSLSPSERCGMPKLVTRTANGSLHSKAIQNGPQNRLLIPKTSTPHCNIHEQPSVSFPFEVATNANCNMNFARNKGRWCDVTDIIPLSCPRYGKLRSSVWRRIFVLPSQVILLVTKLTDNTEWILHRIFSMPVRSFVHYWSRCNCEINRE